MENTILNITLKKGGATANIGGQMGTNTLPLLIFKGPESMPFLAPRGVFLRENQLFV